MKKPYIIGLTGGIGCGKSTVARMLEKRGYPVIDADLLGHRVLEPSHPGFNEVLQAFGKGILDHEGRISRPKLGLMVFQDPKKLEKLNSISHPHIARMIEEESFKLAQEQASRIVFLEAALLIETNWQETCQKVWVIDSKEENVLKRLALRNGLSREEAQQRISSQISSEERLEHADLVLENNGAESELEEKIDEELEFILRFNRAEMSLTRRDN